MTHRFLILLATALCAAAQGVILEGTTTHALTHEPLPGVHVRLILTRGMDPNSMRVFGAISDRTGHFRLGELEPGMYLLMPELRGFIYGQKRKGPMPIASLQVKAGVNEDLRIEMTPRGVIAGRVLDLNGDPLTGARVQLQSVDNIMIVGDVNSNGEGAVSQTDDRGAFRLSGLPGRYYVIAQTWHGDQPETRTDGSFSGSLAPTYYPSSTAKESATVVESRPGAETAGVEIRMSRGGEAPALFSIHGKVTGGTAGGDRSRMAMLRSKKRTAYYSGATGVAPDGSFTLGSVAPGEYEVWASDGDMMSVPLPVTLTNADVNDLELRVIPGATISGVLTVDGDPPGPLKEKWQIRLEPAVMMPRPIGARSAEVDSSGAFRISNVPPFAMRVSLSKPPEGAYLRSATFDGVAMDRQRRIHFTGHDGRLEIVVSRKGATLSGTVTDADGTLLENAMGMVLLVSDPSQLDFIDNGREQSEISAAGKYELKAVAPGTYRLLAVDLMRSDIQEPDAVAKAAAALPEFEVKEGDRLTINLKIAIKENADGKK